ncbi:hypothetical protein ACH47C_03330 [Streptomyces rishiriensis]|uniref:hypothetical protein n=1 Tax=Streptomyces rishiriensis TaxID=68264 RepID=UPI0033FBF0AA
MGQSPSTVPAAGADRGLGRPRAAEQSVPAPAPAVAVRSGARGPGRPVSGHGVTGARERVAWSGGGTP